MPFIIPLFNVHNTKIDLSTITQTKIEPDEIETKYKGNTAYTQSEFLNITKQDSSSSSYYIIQRKRHFVWYHSESNANPLFTIWMDEKPYLNKRVDAIPPDYVLTSEFIMSEPAQYNNQKSCIRFSFPNDDKDMTRKLNQPGDDKEAKKDQKYYTFFDSSKYSSKTIKEKRTILLKERRRIRVGFSDFDSFNKKGNKQTEFQMYNGLDEDKSYYREMDNSNLSSITVDFTQYQDYIIELKLKDNDESQKLFTTVLHYHDGTKWNPVAENMSLNGIAIGEDPYFCCKMGPVSPGGIYQTYIPPERNYFKHGHYDYYPDLTKIALDTTYYTLEEAKTRPRLSSLL